MAHVFLFLFSSVITFLGLYLVKRYKKIDFKSIFSLFFFGILISIPFLMVEYLAGHLPYYLIILVFVVIESLIFFAEHKIKYFHDIIQYNIKHLRITSFLLIGFGFTYSEVILTIFKSGMHFWEFFTVMPFRVMYSLLAHTVLASAANIAQVGSFLAETIYETIIKLVSYFSRITIISFSHYMYVFSHEHHLIFMLAILTLIIIAFIFIKKHLDVKHLGLRSKEVTKLYIN